MCKIRTVGQAISAAPNYYQPGPQSFLMERLFYGYNNLRSMSVKMQEIKTSALYLQKTTKMETTKKRTGLYWVLFLLSVALFFFVLQSPLGSYVSMVLPLNVTFFALALDLL